MNQVATANTQNSTITEDDIYEYNNALVNYENCLSDPNGYPHLKRLFDTIYSFAEKGHVPAQFRVGLAYKTGDAWVKQVDRGAIKFLSESAEQGYAPAQLHFGEMLYSGQGIEKNQNKAIKLYRASAKQGYGEAQYKLALMYKGNDCFPESYSHTYMLMSLAKANGYQSETLQKELDEARSLLAETDSDVIKAQLMAVELWESNNQLTLEE